MKKTYALYIFFCVMLVVFFLSTPQTFAANCTPLLNGGITTQQYCFNPTPTPANINNGQNTTQPPAFPTVPQQTKGGQRIYPAAQSKTTPNTGPEDWSLPILFLIGGMGLWLRKKTKLV